LITLMNLRVPRLPVVHKLHNCVPLNEGLVLWSKSVCQSHQLTSANSNLHIWPDCVYTKHTQAYAHTNISYTRIQKHTNYLYITIGEGL
jgi:hypothetical protein